MEIMSTPAALICWECNDMVAVGCVGKWIVDSVVTPVMVVARCSDCMCDLMCARGYH